MSNPKFTNKLAPAERVTEVYAQLMDLSEQVVWEFQYNPEVREFSRSAKYAEAITSATSTPAQQYLYTTGRTMRLPGLLMESYADGKSLRSQLDALQALLVIDPANRTAFAPKQVIFSWGSERFGPAVITELNWKEMAWLGGEPAMVQMDLVLLELPPPDTEPSQSAQPAPASTLSDRQRADGRRAAQQWLKANANRFTPQTRDIVRTGRFRYLTTGQQISIVRPDGGLIGVIGTYDGQRLNTSTNTLIKDAATR